MNDEEKALFFQSLVERGILLYPAPEHEGELTHYVRKVRTTTDEREYLDGENMILGFEGEDAAIQFLRSYIDWQYEAEEEEPEEPAQMYEFTGTMMVDFGFGPQMFELGNVAHACNTPDWHDEVEASLIEKAKDYVAKNHAHKKWEDLNVQVKFRPAQ